MSIILKGIDMPRKGTNIVLTLYGRDGTYDARTYPSGPRIKGEAIQIPKGHGAIKDINTFLKNKCLTEYIENDVFNKKYSYTIGTGAIYNAPTILEAERE